MPYLTLVPAHEIVPAELRSAAMRGRINDPDFRHRAVMACFGDLGEKPRETAKVLFRLETIPGKPPAFLIQSAVEPQGKVPDGVISKHFDFPQLPVGQAIQLRLSVNAIERRVEGGIRAIPFDSPGDSPMTEWVARKLGEALSEVELTNHTREILGADRRGKRSQKVIQVDTVDGVARVRDPEALMDYLDRGVGRAKSYGCGLLSVKRL